MKTTNDLLKYLKENFTIIDFPNNRELAMLLIYCQGNKNQFLSELPDSMKHLYKKYCNLYTVKQMLAILKRKGNINSISIKLIEALKRDKEKGNTKFVSDSKELKALIYKFL